MKILLLGHKGMLGSDLLTRLSPDHDVTGKDLEDFDLTSAESCRQVVEEVMPQVVINAAAYTDVDGAEKNRDLCFAANVGGVGHLVSACRDHRIRIVHFSTDYVFNGAKEGLYTEEDLTNPLNVYGASKEEGEKILAAYTGPWLLVRTAWLYGKNGRNFVTTILDKTKTTKSLTVVDDQIGSPTYSWDLAGAVKVLLEGGWNGTFHVTNRGVCSWYEFAVKIIQYAGLQDISVAPCNSEQSARPAKRPSFGGLSGKKFTETTGKTMRVWQMALRDFMDHLGHSYR